jgi:hypothetical protein
VRVSRRPSRRHPDGYCRSEDHPVVLARHPFNKLVLSQSNILGGRESVGLSGYVRRHGQFGARWLKDNETPSGELGQPPRLRPAFAASTRLQKRVYQTREACRVATRSYSSPKTMNELSDFVAEVGDGEI